MNKPRRSLLLISFFISALTSVCYGGLKNQPQVDGNSVRAILEKTRDVLKDIHTASYDFTLNQYQEPTDSFYFSSKRFRCIECENPADTAGNAFKIEYDPNGDFHSAYDGTHTYYIRHGKYISKNIPSGFNGIKTVRPPFFNFATSLTDYLLTPNRKMKLELEDYGDHWIVDGKIREFQMVTFFGKPYGMPSLPYSLSHFRLRIRKSDSVPDQISYLMGWPQQRWVVECSNVSLNPFPADSFSVDRYIPDLPEESEGNNTSTKALLKEHLAGITGKAVPADTLVLSDGTSVSLSQFVGSPTLVMLTSTSCGPCVAAYPVVNSFVKDYADKGFQVIGVMRESSAQPEAIAAYRQRHDLQFPLARDNDHLHRYLSFGITPVFVVVDSNNIVCDIHVGFDAAQPEKTENRLRRMIEEHL